MLQKSVICTKDLNENDVIFRVSHEGELELILEKIAASLLSEWRLGMISLTITPEQNTGQYYLTGYELLREYLLNKEVRLYFEANNCISVEQGYDLLIENSPRSWFWEEPKGMPTTEAMIKEYVELWIAEKTDDVSDIDVNIGRIERMANIQEQLDNQNLMPTELIAMTATVLTAGMPRASGAPAHECALCCEPLLPADDVVRTYIGDCHESCANQVEYDDNRIVV